MAFSAFQKHSSFQSNSPDHQGTNAECLNNSLLYQSCTNNSKKATLIFVKKFPSAKFSQFLDAVQFATSKSSCLQNCQKIPEATPFLATTRTPISHHIILQRTLALTLFIQQKFLLN